MANPTTSVSRLQFVDGPSFWQSRFVNAQNSRSFREFVQVLDDHSYKLCECLQRVEIHSECSMCERKLCLNLATDESDGQRGDVLETRQLLKFQLCYNLKYPIRARIKMEDYKEQFKAKIILRDILSFEDEDVEAENEVIIQMPKIFVSCEEFGYYLQRRLRRKKFEGPFFVIDDDKDALTISSIPNRFVHCLNQFIKSSFPSIGADYLIDEMELEGGKVPVYSTGNLKFMCLTYNCTSLLQTIEPEAVYKEVSILIREYNKTNKLMVLMQPVIQITLCSSNRDRFNNNDKICRIVEHWRRKYNNRRRGEDGYEFIELVEGMYQSFAEEITVGVEGWPLETARAEMENLIDLFN